MLQSLARRVAHTLGRNNPLIRGARPLYETLLHWTSGGRGIPWTINGVEYRIDPRYRHMMGGAYDPHLAEWLSARVKPGDVSLDVGANVGIYVLQLAHWSRPDGRVIAIEPNPRTRAILERHVHWNGLADRVEIVAAAAGAATGEASLFAAEADGMSRLGAPNALLAERAEAVTVPVVTLDEVCSSRGISPQWLFLDIEGFEIAALTGARQLLERTRGCMGIVVEMHPNVWDSAGTTRESTERLLRELQFTAEPLSGQSDPLGQHGHVSLTPACAVSQSDVS